MKVVCKQIKRFRVYFKKCVASILFIYMCLNKAGYLKLEVLIIDSVHHKIHIKHLNLLNEKNLREFECNPRMLVSSYLFTKTQIKFTGIRQ